MPTGEASGLDPEAVLASLRVRGLLGADEDVADVADLSPGLGRVRVFRVEVGRPSDPSLGAEPGSFARMGGTGRALLLKILDWRTSTRLATDIKLGCERALDAMREVAVP